MSVKLLSAEFAAVSELSAEKFNGTLVCCRLVSSDISCFKIQLLIFTYFEQGSLYQQLKDHYEAEWMEKSRSELDICSHTANRYITFYELVATYPRIVICELSFETIMFCKTAIIEELQQDAELSMRFRVLLREISIYANINVGGGATPSLDYSVTAEDKKTNWGAAWDRSDIIQANEEEKEEI